MKIILKSLLAVLFIFYFSFSQTTGGIKGIVKDSATGEAIPFSVIMVNNTKIGGSSNSSGFFILKNIPASKQKILVNAIGYKKYSKYVDIKENEIIIFNIILSPEPIQLKPVIKEAERQRGFYEANISVQSISQEELKIVPITIEKDLFRMMKVLPGISSTGDVTSQFYVRGGAGDQNLILVDNMIIYNPFHAFGLFSLINTEVIKNAEILTGGFNPQFGGRLSSVINIITKEGDRNNFGGKLNAGVLSGSAALNGPIPGGAFSLSYRKSYFNDVLKKFLGKETPLSFYDFNGKLSFDISEISRGSINTLLSADDLINPKISEPDYSWRNNAIGLSFQSFLEQYLISVSFSWSSFKGTKTTKTEDSKSGSESNIQNFLFNTNLDYLFDNNDLFSFGCTLNMPQMKYILVNSANYLIERNDNVSEAGFWLKYKLTQLENLILEMGVRNEFSFMAGKSFFNFEPRINLKYKIYNDFYLKSSYTRMHQCIMTTSNEDDVIPTFETWIALKNTNDPEIADQYVLGFENLISDNIHFSIQGYLKNIKNYTGYNLNKVSNHDPDFSIGSGVSKGIETFIKIDFNGYYLQTTYNLSWADKTINGISFPPRYDKRHILNVLGGIELPGDIDFNFHWEYSTGMPFTPTGGYFDKIFFDIYPYNYLPQDGTTTRFLGIKNSKRLSAYHKLDIGISKTFAAFYSKKVNLNLDLINIYDKKNIFYYNRETNERVDMLPFMISLSLGVEL